jgi:endonuclease
MRLIVARCSAIYSGRLDTVLPEALRLLMFKADGSVLIHADAGGYKPLNWMTPPTVIEENTEAGTITVRKFAGKSEDRLEITLTEVLSDVTHEMEAPDPGSGLTKDGVEAHLQELLAEQPHWCGEGLKLVKREFFTDIGPVDLLCRDSEDQWVMVEIKRTATIEAVEQLTRYLERMAATDPKFADARGVLAAQQIKPQARTLAEGRGIECVEVDLAVLRGEREPELKLFG